jgi:hypothetical protein
LAANLKKQQDAAKKEERPKYLDLDPREGLEGGRATCTLQAILLGQSIRTALTPHLNKLISRPAGPPRLRANWGEASPQAILAIV